MVLICFIIKKHFPFLRISKINGLPPKDRFNNFNFFFHQVRKKIDCHNFCHVSNNLRDEKFKIIRFSIQMCMVNNRL